MHSFSSPELLESRIAPATLVVTSAADSGPGTLREAVSKSNASPALDVIVFSLPAQTVITLASEIDISASVTINGPGMNSLAINGNAVSRIFGIDDGMLGTGTTVTIHGLALLNGKSGTAGGAIYSAEALVVDSCLLQGNTASLSGGAIALESTDTKATLVVSNSYLIENSAQTGGGLDATATGNILVYGSFLYANRGDNLGGGASLSESGSSIGDIYVVNSTIWGNTSSEGGGGLALTMSRESGRSIVYQSLIGSNRVSSEGGGGIEFNGGNGYVVGSRLVGNQAQYGGGVHWSGTSLFVGTSSFQRNIAAENDSAGNGGALNLEGDASTRATVDTAEFVANREAGDLGGGAIYDSGASLTLHTTSFRNNTATGVGGGLAVLPFSASTLDLKISNTEFVENQARGGGAIGIEKVATVSLQSVSIAHNRAETGLVGGLYASEVSSSFSLSSVAITGNSATKGSGGADLTIQGTTTIDHVLISDNTAGFNSDEGGLGLYGSGAKSINFAVISNNHAGRDGGGIYLGAASGALAISNSQIINNSVGRTAGGIFAAPGASVSLAPSVLVAGNVSPDGVQKNF